MSLDVLKLYCGEDVVRQEPEDIDPYRWLDEGELIELPGHRGGEGIHRTISRSEEPGDTS